MGTVRRKRALLKKVTSFNLYADQWAQIQAIMEGSRAEKEAPVLRELIDEALGARRRKFVRQDQEETPTANLEVEALETIRLLMVKLLHQSQSCLRVDRVNLRPSARDVSRSPRRQKVRVGQVSHTKLVRRGI